MTARLLRLPPLHPVDARLVESLFGEEQLAIDGAIYTVEPLPERPSIAAAFTLHKVGGDSHDVWVTADGMTGCSCMNFQCESGPQSRLCKHLFAMADVGKLPIPGFDDIKKRLEKPT